MQQQPTLFKSHEQKLSTAQQGITSIPNHAPRLPQTRKKMSLFKRLFSRKSSASEDGSHLSIDYDQFHITDAPQAKRFSDSLVNPQINFNEEGKLPQNEEMELIMTTTGSLSGAVGHHIEYVENDIYESESSSSLHTKSAVNSNTDALPVTSIDDVDVASDFDVYEHVQYNEDFHAM